MTEIGNNKLVDADIIMEGLFACLALNCKPIFPQKLYTSLKLIIVESVDNKFKNVYMVTEETI
jgi:hypothetical protein